MRLIFLRKLASLWDSAEIKRIASILAAGITALGAGYSSYGFLSPTSLDLQRTRSELVEWRSNGTKTYLEKYALTEDELNYISKNRDSYLDFFNSLLAIDPGREDSRIHLEESYRKASRNPEILYDLAYILDKSTKLHKFDSFSRDGKCEIVRRDRKFGEQLRPVEPSASPHQLYFISPEKLADKSKAIALSELRPRKADGDLQVTKEKEIVTFSTGYFWHNADGEALNREIKCLSINIIAPKKKG